MYMPREVMIAVRVPHGSLVQIEALADKSGMTVSKWAKTVVMRALAEKRNGPAMLTPGDGLAAPSAVSAQGPLTLPRRQHGELGDENGSVAAYSSDTESGRSRQAKDHSVETVASPSGFVTNGWSEEGVVKPGDVITIASTPAINPPRSNSWADLEATDRAERFKQQAEAKELPPNWTTMPRQSRMDWLDKEWPL